MAENNDDAAAKSIIADVAEKLAAKKACPNKDFLIKLLRQAAGTLPELKQSPLLSAVVKPLNASLVKHSLLKHKDKDVKLLVATCFCEIIRILAPNPDFSDELLRDIFLLFISMFEELADTSSPYFSRRVKLLETVAKLEFCVLMIDTGSEDLILKMFTVFYDVVREQHPHSVFNAMSSTMALILKEKVSESLLVVTLQNLLNEAKAASPAFKLAVAVIQSCSEQLEPSVCGFLTSCILDRNAVGNDLRESYHEIIFEIFRCAPQMLLAVIPNLTHELLTDQVDVRIKAINLIGRLFALPGCHVAQEYGHVFVEFLNRFSDKSPEVRISVLSSAKAFYLTHPLVKESEEILIAVEERLLDFDDKVRAQAITVVSDLAKSNIKSFPPYLISEAAKRFRDKKVSVRRRALQKLLPVYHDYCAKCCEGLMSLSDHFEAIPCGMLMLYYDTDCKDFGPLNMEHMLAENLFPNYLSVEERTRHWIFFVSLHKMFTLSHEKALNSILSHKQRLQTELKLYLELRRNEEGIGSDEMEKRKRKQFIKMSKYFLDPSKAGDCFDILDQVKDCVLFNKLEELLDEVTIESGQALIEKLVRDFGDQDSNSEFLQLLLKKCFFNIFGSEHVSYILNQLSSDLSGNETFKDSSMKLLLIIISNLPSLVRGLEEQLCCLLLQEDIPFNEGLIQMIAKAGPYISYKLSDLYPSLERICLMGTRTQSKLAVSAIAAIASSSEQSIFTNLCKKLVDALENGQNIPTVLQSLGCLAQYSAPTFESHVQDIGQYIIKKIFQVEISDEPTSFEKTSNGTSSSRLKIFGLKALVKSCLPYQRTHTSRHITKLLHEILQMLQKGDCSDLTMSCKTSKFVVNLAAAKSVLRLSRRWDLYISPSVFRLTVSMAKDPSSLIRRSFVDKTFKLLKEHIIPSRYACAFALAASCSDKDMQKDSLRYMAEYIRGYSKGADLRQNLPCQGRLTGYPVYTVVFLIHVLAHDDLFPLEACANGEVFAQFCSPLLFTLNALVNAKFVDGDQDLVNNVVSNLKSIFNAIKRAEDAVDSQATPKLHMLADFGLSFANTLEKTSAPNSQSPSHVLLPSSLYKNRTSEKRKALSNASDRNISTKVVNEFKEFSCPVRTTGNDCRSQENSSESDAIKGSLSNMDICNKVELPTYMVSCQNKIGDKHGKGQTEALKEKVDSVGSQSPAPSPCVLESSGLHNEFSLDDELDEGETRSSEPIIGNEQLPSSCGSLAMKPLRAHREDLSSSDPLHKNDIMTKRSSSLVEASKILQTKQTDHWNLKDSCSLQLLNCDHQEQSVVSGPWEMVDAFSSDSSQSLQNMSKKENSYLMNRKLPLAVTGNKGHQVSVNTLASEVINQDAIAHRTRRRKI
ncbi:sister chromatid cohesion protein PDS5-like [Heracleum sosnowskyi]|uniref:Sister chromatid cohesion protein PDS5-like n=1 Tax=Heracleum sosnowskyi TaxID=360622 RepID=A0AAD8HS36_9APIA|nr:sister chromatid cohesion protein PDS5-like [Heracleum sosnowskyi]